VTPGLLTEIESYRFSARLNIASSLSAFARGLLLEESVVTLIEGLRDRENARKLLRRIVFLSGMVTNRDYEDPNDAAMATYLWTLAESHRDLAMVGVDATMRVANIWWAKKVCDLILAPQTEIREEANQRASMNIFPLWETQNLLTQDSTNQLRANLLNRVLSPSMAILSIGASPLIRRAANSHQDINPRPVNVVTPDAPPLEKLAW
jgi:hypothetical protein